MAALALAIASPLTPAATGIAPPAPSPAAQSGGSSFASQLDRAQQAPADDPADASTAKPQASDAPSATDSRDTAKSDAAKDPAADAATAGADADAKTKAADDDHDKSDDDATAAPDLSALLPGWHASVDPRIDTTQAGGARGSDAHAAAVGARDARARAGVERALAQGQAPDDAPATAVGAARRFATELAAAATAAAGKAVTAAGADAPARDDHRGLESLAGSALAALSAPGAAPVAANAQAAPAPADVPLAAQVGTPEFAPALGAQISVFARDGIHEARLQLNPADMGPIAVQIAVDGSTAQVHFQADVAATRQALENSLPDLAAALREGGFTLSGGGVSEQRQGGSPRGAQDGSRGIAGVAGAGRGRSGQADDAAVATARPVARPQGVVDLFA